MVVLAWRMPDEREYFERKDTGTVSFNFSNTDFDIDLLKKEVGQHFPFYDIKYNVNTVAFFCRTDEENLEKNFNSLRIALAKKGYIPMIRYDAGEHIIYIIRKVKVKRKPVWINAVLLIATVFTTTLAGSIQWIGIYEPNVTSFILILNKMTAPHYLWNGFIFFSLPLLSILGVHEMGHYFISRKHNLETSLPYFIPLPPPFILGTFGALISTKEPIPDRKTLLDVGVSGPICGFLIAIPVSILGFFLMQQNPILPPSDLDTGLLALQYPLLLQWISSYFTIPPESIIHPTLFAGWVGIFLTAINLLPAGQLDGGHVARALLKEKHRYASWLVVFVIFGLGLIYPFWLMFAFIILFLIGTQHQPPLNELTPLNVKRTLLGILAIFIFILCFAPIPMAPMTS